MGEILAKGKKVERGGNDQKKQGITRTNKN